MLPFVRPLPSTRSVLTPTLGLILILGYGRRGVYSVSSGQGAHQKEAWNLSAHLTPQAKPRTSGTGRGGYIAKAPEHRIKADDSVRDCRTFIHAPALKVDTRRSDRREPRVRKHGQKAPLGRSKLWKGKR